MIDPAYCKRCVHDFEDINYLLHCRRCSVLVQEMFSLNLCPKCYDENKYYCTDCDKSLEK